jgi:hypothetical protein
VSHHWDVSSRTGRRRREDGQWLTGIVLREDCRRKGMNPDLDSEYFLFDIHRVLLLALSAWLLSFDYGLHGLDLYWAILGS